MSLFSAKSARGTFVSDRSSSGRASSNRATKNRIRRFLLHVGMLGSVCFGIPITANAYQAAAGQSAAGQSDAGQSDAGQSDAGQSDAGQSVSGQSESGQFDRMLATGEYTLAIQSARQNNNQQQLQQIADHQSRHGAIASAIALSGSAYRSQSYRSDRSGAGNGSYDRAPANQGAMGGQVQADFTSLINLIETTVDPLSWESAGGVGVITPYTNGVLIDVSGRLGLSEKLNQSTSRLLESPSLNLANQPGLAFISLPKLEQELIRRSKSGQSLTPTLKYLDGLYDIRYILLDRANNDLMLVGPAGPWEENEQGVAVNVETGKAVMQLDDLVICLRTVLEGKGVVGCSIDPRPGQFQEIANYLNKHRVTSEKQRDQMRSAVGPQDAKVFGVPSTSHAAHVLLTADYHLKMLAMGNINAGRLLPSYLDLCQADDPPTEVIRWWFTLGQPEVQKNLTGDIFVLNGNPLQLKTESQLINRKKAANNSLAAEQFVSQFNRKFADVEKQFPLYGQLENIFELTIAAGVLETNHLPEAANWQGDFLLGRSNLDRYQPQRYQPITEVELVVNHRKFKFRNDKGSISQQIVTAVSGGVDLRTSPKQVSAMTESIENHQVPAEFLQSLQPIQSNSADQTSDHFRWSRR